MQKMIQLDIRSRNGTKKSDSDSQCCQESDSTQKPPTPYDSGSYSATLLITNVLLQLVRDIINGVCYQRYEKRLEQLKRSSKCKCLRCRGKFGRGTISKSVFDCIVSIHIQAHSYVLVRNTNFLDFYCTNMGFLGVQSLFLKSLNGSPACGC